MRVLHLLEDEFIDQFIAEHFVRRRGLPGGSDQRGHDFRGSTSWPDDHGLKPPSCETNNLFLFKLQVLKIFCPSGRKTD